MGHTDHERRRLSLQAQALNPLTKEFFQRAGIAEGMRIVDFGCGVGEVSLIAARIAGPTGSVTGIDMDPEALEIARQRAIDAEIGNARFVQSGFFDFAEGAPYDAVVGRLILIHMPDAAAAVQHAAALVRPGGIVAFQDYDLSPVVPIFPEKPLLKSIMQLITDLFTRALPSANMGMRLYSLLAGAGLETLQCRAEAPIFGPEDAACFEWFAETIRSVLPKLEALGLTTAAELDVDTLAERLQEEGRVHGGCVAGPIIFGASGRKPGVAA
jgi:ubiquinone/menaquinone biosynthesis C-methylase UbiE